MLKIAILPGDDIGLEVVPEAVKVMKAAAAMTGAGIDWHPLPIGRRGHESRGHTFPKETEEALLTMHGWVQGPMGHSAYPRNDPTWHNPPTRKRYDLFANVKPVKSYPNLPSLHKNVDMSGKMLLEWLGRKHAEPKAVAAAALMERAMERVIAEGGALTPDLGGGASTAGMGDAVAAAVQRPS